jgi:hypothetical protein
MRHAACRANKAHGRIQNICAAFKHFILNCPILDLCAANSNCWNLRRNHSND